MSNNTDPSVGANLALHQGGTEKKQVTSGGDSASEKGSQDSGALEEVRTKVVAVDDGSDSSSHINLKGLSWQATTALLFGEYICLAIAAVPSSFALLGMAGGLLAIVGVGLITLYTSLTLWKYCMKHPDQLNIADIGGRVFARKEGGFSRIGYEFTGLVLLLNNIFIQGFHIQTASRIINTLNTNPGNGWCTVALSVFMTILSALCTLPRQLTHVASMSIASAISMGIALLLILIFSSIQGKNPYGMPEGASVTISAFAPAGTTFVQGFSAFLNIAFLWIGQICYPTFIAEMKDPREFPKALYALTVAEFTVFSLVGIWVYALNGQFSGAPAVVVLKPVFKKIAFAFVFPTTIIIGVIYGSVASKLLFARFFAGTRHYDHHTVVGWVGWTSIVFATWFIGFVIGEAVPFFGDFLSLCSALFDSYIGFILWAAAYWKLNQGNLWVNRSLLGKAESLFNLLLVPFGLFMLGPGLYASVESIRASYRDGYIKSPFTCASNAV